jgi:RNA polymerase sigma-70 factor (ECF subfamily)
MSDAPAGVLAAPDDDLIDRARRGESPAREELFRRHFGIAYRVAHRLLGHDQDALDAVQDAYLKALRHLHEFDGRSGFRTWLLRIVTNAALDLGRRRRRRGTILSLHEASAAAELDPAHVEDPGRGLHAQELRVRLNAALAHLSPAIRTTFVLFAEAGLSYKEIAETQNVPIGTVMSRLHFARNKLQGYLGDLDR